MNLLATFDDFLDGITMYRLVLYGLSALVGIGMLLSLLGTLSFSWLGLVENLVVLSAVCFSVNQLLARLFKAVPNFESSIITTLILSCILPPGTGPSHLLLVGLAGAIAIASKYLITWHRKHLFNPAALAAVVMGLTGWLAATWWVGAPAMLPFTLLIGLLIVRKLRRFTLVMSFAVVATSIIAAVGVSHGTGLGLAIRGAFTSWPLVFLGTIMLTEPSTTPPRLRDQVVYGMLVGALFGSELHIGHVGATPELSLLIGNLFAAAVTPLYQLKLRLKRKIKLSEQVYEYVFTPDRTPRFAPGQYMEWTLPLGLLVDSRGNRRTFTVASSPTEPDVHLGVKFYPSPSSFKSALAELQPGDSLMAGHASGSFTLPADASQKLAFVAGGIGITPFRSMLKYLIDTNQHRDITLFYAVSTPAEISFADILDAARQHGVKIVPIAAKVTPSDNWSGHTGFLDEAIIREEAPDFADRLFYASGPPVMVRHARQLLRELGVPRRQIKTDFFAGY